MNSMRLTLLALFYAKSASASEKQSFISEIQRISDSYGCCSATSFFLFALAGSLFSVWIYRTSSEKCRMYQKKLDADRLRFADMECRLTSCNRLQEKRLQIRADYTKNVSLNVKRADEQRNSVCLYSLLRATLRAWSPEFRELGVRIRLEASIESSYIQAGSFFLDDVFNAVIANILFSAQQGQSFLIAVENRCSDLTVTIMEDMEQSMPKKELQLTTDSCGPLYSVDSKVEIDQQITESGGYLTTYMQDGKRVTSISWPLASESIPLVSKRVVEENKAQSDSQREDDSSPDDPWLMKVYQLVEDNFTDAAFGTSVAASRLYLSERSLQRKFKKLAGKTFIEHLIEVRLEHAREQLLAGNKVLDVALASGFNDPSYFSRRFRIRYGISPSQVNVLPDSQ